MIVEELVGRIGLDFTGAGEAAKAVSAVDSVKGAFQGAFAILGVFRAGLEALVIGTANEALEMEHFSEAVGVSTQTLQALGVAAGRAGGSIDDVETSLRFLARASVESLADGGEKLQGVFAQLGVKVTDANGKLKTVEQLLPDVAKGFENIHDPSKRVAASMELFGRSGLKTLQALQQAGPDLQGFTQSLIASGRVFTKETEDRFVNVAKGVKGLTGRVKGFSNLLAAAFLPFTEKTLKSLQDGFDKVTPHAQEFATRFANLIGKSFEGVMSTGVALFMTLGKLFNSLPGWAQIAIELALALGALALAFALPGVPIAILAFLIASVFEDLQNFRDGVPSLIGDIVKEFDNFKFQLQDIAENGHGVAKVIATITNAIVELTQAIASLLSGGGMKAVQSALEPKALNNEDVQRAMTIRGMLQQNKANRQQQDVIDETVRDPFSTFSQSKYDAAGAMQGISGSGIPSAYRGSAPTINQGNVSVNVTAAPGMGEQELADKVASAVDLKMSMQAEEVASAFGRQ